MWVADIDFSSESSSFVKACQFAFLKLNFLLKRTFSDLILARTSHKIETVLRIKDNFVDMFDGLLFYVITHEKDVRVVRSLPSTISKEIWTIWVMN